MASYLKDLKITSTDLVEQGANPDAYIRLFKMSSDKSTTAKEETKMDDVSNRAKSTTAGEAPAPETVPMPEPVPAQEPDAEVAKDAEIQKALSEYTAIAKAQAAEIEELKKSLEIERLVSFAKKYEVIGKKPEELAAKLYELKKAGAGGAYDDYVALLDEHVALVEKSGLFTEIGKNTSGSISVEAQIQAAAAEIRKSNAGLNEAAAFVKALEGNPELMEKYETSYREDK